MARAPAGPLGNSPRDGRDDFIGEEAEDLKTGAPPRWPPKPKKITRNDFHAKVGGGNAAKRADRAPHYRRGGFVSARREGGDIKPLKIGSNANAGPLERLGVKTYQTEVGRIRKGQVGAGRFGNYENLGDDPGYKSGGSPKKKK